MSNDYDIFNTDLDKTTKPSVNHSNHTFDKSSLNITKDISNSTNHKQSDFTLGSNQ